MIIPSYWAEGRCEQRIQKRMVKLRRWGWSNVSQEEAQAHADARVQAAMAGWVRGDSMPRREPKVPYNGAVSLPIREETVEHHGSTIITRNAYGAQCLNTPNVLFADVDFALERSAWPQRLALFWGPIIVATLLARHWLPGYPWVLWWVLATVAQISYTSTQMHQRRKHRAVQAKVLARAQQWVAQHPSWGLRLYRTPAGVRMLATHRLLDPNEAEVERFFKAMNTDPLYAAMCRNQQCFRARLTAKPWNMLRSIRPATPRPAPWPTASQEALERRSTWLSTYDRAAQRYAACQWVSTIGHPTVHFEVQPVLHLHDTRCQAHSTQALG